MRYRVRTVLTVLLAALTGGVIAAAPAGAITGGEIDTTGKEHPNVGMIIYYTPEGRFRCSATLVTSTVLLTAAHCTDGTRGDTLVSFDPDIAQNSTEAAVTVPRAADDKGDGMSATGYRGAPKGWLAGKAHTHEDYSNFTDLNNWNDVGVVVLYNAVRGITPASIAPTNYLDQFNGPRLSSTLFRAVGYGTEVRKPESGPQKPTPMSYPIVRRYTDVPGQKLTAQILQVNGNENDPRGGGTCFGDSGGPSFKNGVVVTVTSYGYTSNCRYIDGLQRVDIPVVQTWLAKFGVTPAKTTKTT
jgi:hypothetical protein